MPKMSSQEKQEEEKAEKEGDPSEASGIARSPGTIGSANAKSLMLVYLQHLPDWGSPRVVWRT